MPRISFASSSGSTRSWVCGGGFDVSVLDERSGRLTLRVTGKNAITTFADEAGGHRFQRVPPNEKRGRVHTSTVTIAILPEPRETELQISDRDIEWTACRGSGAGGQHRNMTDSAVQVFHRPTGVMVRCESERSQHQNRASAMALLRARIWERKNSQVTTDRNDQRRAQVGLGQRGDKRRTIRFQDEVVNDHLTGRHWQLKKYLRGEW